MPIFLVKIKKREKEVRYPCIKCLPKIELESKLAKLMRRSRSRSRKMWWVVVPCTRKKSLKTESNMDIEEILKMKLATIIEEEPADQTSDQENGGIVARNNRSSSCMSLTRKGKKIHLKMKMRRLFLPQFSLKESYVIFMTGLASKSGLHGLPRC